MAEHTQVVKADGDRQIIEPAECKICGNPCYKPCNEFRQATSVEAERQRMVTNRISFEVDVIVCLADQTWRPETLRVETYYRRLAFTLAEDRVIERHGLDKSVWCFAVDARIEKQGERG